MTLGLGNQNSAQYGSLNLSATGAPSSFGQASSNGFAMQQPMMPQANPFMAGMAGGAGYGDQYGQYAGAPIAPPSDTEILASMLSTLAPVDRFIVSQNMPVFVEMLSALVSYSVLNVLKNAKFNFDEDNDIFALDITSLPTELQTLSADSVIAQLSALQNNCNTNIQGAEAQRQQIMALADQSMLQGALNTALADPGMLQNIGSGIGNAARGLIYGGRI